MSDLPVDNNKLIELAQKLGLRFVILHGSRADNSAHDESDVDVAVYLEPGRLEHFGFSAYEAILNGLVDALGTAGIGKLDLVILNDTNILLRYEITQKGKLLYGNALTYLQYCAFAYRDYIDARPLFNLENALILKRQTLIQNHATR